MKTLALAVGLFALSVAAPARASGTTYNGFVCDVEYVPNGGVAGQHGTISIQLYSGPSCTGTQLGAFSFCTTGATWVWCDPNHLYSEAAIMQLWQSLMSALQNNFKTSVWAESSGAYTTHAINFSRK
jgi:hypothetical protein